MRSAEGDYPAIEAALSPHQVRTLHDLAVAVGLPARKWWTHTQARILAKELAVANVVRRLCDEGLPLRQAINRAASQFDLDTETLQRRYRMFRRLHKSGG